MPITKAVIAAGGWSTRFLPAVKVYAKQLVPLWDKPQIQLVVEELIGAGITDIAIVMRQGEETIKSYFAPNPEMEGYLASVGKSAILNSWRQVVSQAKFTYLYQTPQHPYGNGTPILVAQNFIGDDSFVYLWGDDLTIEQTPGNFLKGMLELHSKYHPDIVLSTVEVPWEEVYRYGTIKYHPHPTVPNQVIDIPEKLPQSEAPSNLINGARFLVTPKIIDILKQQQLDRGELWYTAAETTLAKTGIVITANYHDYQADWTTTGDPKNWLKANLRLALQAGHLTPEDIQSLLPINQTTI
jgi:UTP--glucose-1-phosphate uridylyltransferase